MKKLLSVLSVLIIALAGCSTSSEPVAVGGSTSVTSLFDSYIEEYTAENPSAEISYDAKGSGAATEGINNGTYNIGTLSRETKPEEQDASITESIIAIDGIAVATHPNNPVKELSMQQLLDIYTGKITNWKEVGGNDKTISVISREDNSGTRSAFEELVGFGPDADTPTPLVQTAILAGSNGEVAQTVQGNEDAIGYLSFATLEENKTTLNPVAIEKVNPTIEEVLAGNYLLSRPFIMVYKEAELSDSAKDFVSWIEENKDALAEENGYIPAG